MNSKKPTNAKSKGQLNVKHGGGREKKIGKDGNRKVIEEVKTVTEQHKIQHYIHNSKEGESKQERSQGERKTRIN